MKIRTDFVTNSSSSSFVAVTLTNEDGEVIYGETSMGSGYHEMPILYDYDEEDDFIKETLKAVKGGVEFCEKLYDRFLYDTHSIHDGLYEIRDVEDFSKLESIKIEVKQEGSNGGRIEYCYDFKTDTAKAELGSVEWDYYDEFQEEVLQEYFEGIKGMDSDDDNFEIKDGVVDMYKGRSSEVVIPDGIIGLGHNSFYYSTSIKEVFLPDSVKFIDCGAFANCSKLEKINFPNTLQCIGAKAFEKCVSLKAVDIPPSVIEIGYKCFNAASGLKEITIPDSITVIKAGAFYGCTKLEKVNLPDSLSEIGEEAFSGCHSLKEIKIPEGVSKLGKNVFWDCKNLETIYLPSTVKDFFAGQICYCNNLKSIKVSENNTNLVEIGGGLYTGDMKKLIKCVSDKKEFTVQDGTVYIGEYAFEGNKFIETVSLPNTVKSIGIESFANCKSLKEIDLPSSVISLCKDAFHGCVALEKAYVPKRLEIDLYDCFDMWRDNFTVIRK